jgi:hypothetical protein
MAAGTAIMAGMVAAMGIVAEMVEAGEPGHRA